MLRAELMPAPEVGTLGLLFPCMVGMKLIAADSCSSMDNLMLYLTYFFLKAIGRSENSWLYFFLDLECTCLK